MPLLREGWGSGWAPLHEAWRLLGWGCACGTWVPTLPTPPVLGAGPPSVSTSWACRLGAQGVLGGLGGWLPCRH